MGMSLFVRSCCAHGCHLPALGAHRAGVCPASPQKAGCNGVAPPHPLLSAEPILNWISPGDLAPMSPLRHAPGSQQPCQARGWVTARCLAGSELVREVSLGDLSASREEEGGWAWPFPTPCISAGDAGRPSLTPHPLSPQGQQPDRPHRRATPGPRQLPPAPSHQHQVGEGLPGAGLPLGHPPAPPGLPERSLPSPRRPPATG